MTHVVTVGTATFDVFLTGDNFRAKRDVRSHDYIEQFPLGVKVEVDDVVFSTGGDATNAAVTFARHGFNTAFMGKIGDDIPGREVIAALKNDGVHTNLMAVDTDGRTDYSTILLSPTGERTVLIYHGLSHQLSTDDFDLGKIKGELLYVTSMGGNLEFLKAVLESGKKAGMRVAYNPGAKELKEPSKLKELLQNVDLLSANREELGILFGQAEPKELLKKASKVCKYVLLSDGPKGSWATDGEKLYRAGLYKDVKVVDRTGAGDAFGSGFAASLLQQDSIEEALTFASANSTNVVQHIGSKTGIIKKNTRLAPMKIEVSSLT